MENIQRALREIEQQHNIRILYACETGSRAWGFPSPDSDYDIRFIYMHDRDWYLQLNDRKDSIEVKLEGDLDISGWDIRKSLLLLKKSNAPLIERFNSPIEYFSVDGFKDEFTKLIGNYYSPVAVFWHHYSLAEKFWEDLREKDEIKLKSFFYLIRSMLSCYWITKDDSVVPMQVGPLMTKIDNATRHKLEELIKLKSTVGEKYFHAADPGLNDRIMTLWNELSVAKDHLKAARADYSLLNSFFIKLLHGTNAG